MKVVELDPIVLDLAREYFSFVEDDQLKVEVLCIYTVLLLSKTK